MEPRTNRLRVVPKTNASTSVKAELYRYIQGVVKFNCMRVKTPF